MQVYYNDFMVADETMFHRITSNAITNKIFLNLVNSRLRFAKQTFTYTIASISLTTPTIVSTLSTTKHSNCSKVAKSHFKTLFTRKRVAACEFVVLLSSEI